MSKKSRRQRPSLAQAREDLQRSGQQEGNPTMLVIALIATTIFMGVYYHAIVLPNMAGLADGQTMLDHRFGFDTLGAMRLAETMDADTMGQLNFVHITAGIIFPIFLALLSFVLTVWALKNKLARLIAAIIGVVFIVVHIWQNNAIDGFLADPTPAGASTAMTLVTICWVLLGVLVLWCIACIVLRIARRNER